MNEAVGVRAEQQAAWCLGGVGGVDHRAGHLVDVAGDGREQPRGGVGAQERGRCSGVGVDLLAMLMSLVTSWLSAPVALKELGGGGDPMAARRLNQHRRALVEAVTRVVTPR